MEVDATWKGKTEKKERNILKRISQPQKAGKKWNRLFSFTCKTAHSLILISCKCVLSKYNSLHFIESFQLVVSSIILCFGYVVFHAFKVKAFGLSPSEDISFETK